MAFFGGSSAVELYCLMVRNGCEAQFKERAEETLAAHGIKARLYFFQRTFCRRAGEYVDAPVFPGYLFLQVERLSGELVTTIKDVEDYLCLLPADDHPKAIQGGALEDLKLFLGHGEYFGISRVAFLSGRRMRAVSGPMVGLEDSVYKVNKKKHRITVATSLSPEGKNFDLLYEEAEPLEGWV